MMASFRYRFARPLTLALLFAATACQAARAATLWETGAGPIQVLFEDWARAFGQANPDVRVETATEDGGAGQDGIDGARAPIVALDHYPDDGLMRRSPGMLAIPLAVDSQMVTYNVPGLNGSHLRFSGAVLADIYRGKIRYWNDPEIVKLNPTARLPGATIVPIHRTDACADTLLFTWFLSRSAPDWAATLPHGPAIDWPVGVSSLAAEGNQGVIDLLQRTAYGLAYVGFSFRKPVNKAGLGVALLQNRAGIFTLPTSLTIGAALDGARDEAPHDGRLDLVFRPGENVYPMVTCWYAIVRAEQPDPWTAQDLKAFLRWVVQPGGGNAEQFLRRVSVLPLPASVRRQSEAQIDKISG
jgi:phosphate transport system substrate-binding protein